VPLAFAQSDLPPTVQADLLRDQIYAEAKANDSDAVIRSIDEYHKLILDAYQKYLSDPSRYPEAQYNFAFPRPLYWIEAKAAHEAGDPKRALSSLSDFLRTADRASDQYKEALALYPKYQHDAAAAGQQESDARRHALVMRVPEVLAQIEASAVPLPGGIAKEMHFKDKTTGQLIADGFEFGTRIYVDQDIKKGNGLFSQYQIADVREFKLRSIYLTKTAVTHFWWDVFAADTGHKSFDEWRGDNSQVSFPAHLLVDSDLNDFTAWVSSRTGKAWRLPSEAEMVWMAQEIAGENSASSVATSGLTLGRKVHGYVTSDSSYWDIEIVSDCWHATFVGAPPDGAPWLTQCDLPMRLALSFDVAEIAEKGHVTHREITIRRHPQWVNNGNESQGVLIRLARDE